MTNQVEPAAIGVFLFFFALVFAMGFVAARWRKPETLAHLDEWGLGGRQFGTWITWFLIGGDFYTAYTVIAVPAVVYGLGAYGFFALPYTIIVYPFVFAVMPLLWKVAKDNNYVTAGDVVFGRYGSRSLEAAVAATGVVATMPYIALQLVGMAAVIKALGLTGEIPLIIAFLILALYTYSSGLRAPALIAFVKDIMIYIAVIAAVVIIPAKLGGYGAIFAAAGDVLDKRALASGGKIAAGLTPKPGQVLPYATLAFGSAMAAFMYPHTLTGIFASKSAQTIRKNAVLLPAYALLLGLLALLGYVAIAAHINVADKNEVVPARSSRRNSRPGSPASLSRRWRSARWCRPPSCRSARRTFSPATSGRPTSTRRSRRPARHRLPRSPRLSSSSVRSSSSSPCPRSSRSTFSSSAACGSCKRSRPWSSDSTPAGLKPPPCWRAGRSGSSPARRSLR